MTVSRICPVCQSQVEAPSQYGGRRVRCPTCKSTMSMPHDSPAEEEVVTAEIVPDPVAAAVEEIPSWDIPLLGGLHGARKAEEFLDPPEVTFRAKPQTATARPAVDEDWAKRMFAALLDPRSIQWLLTLGGGLMVLGVLIWLISWGVLENPWAVALILGLASLGVLAGGCLLTLKTSFQVTGRALAFLGCVIVPLNLWFYHAQGLVTLEGGLWLGGVVCVLLYAATTWLLRDPLFVYAVEAGITLTAVLLLGNFGLEGQSTHLSVLLMALALISIHAQKAFPPAAEHFSQERFGLPLFWCGHAQLTASLIVLVVTQAAGAMVHLANVFDLPPEGIPLTNSNWVPGLLWLAGAYAYLYSDLAVRRVGVYIYLAAVSLVMAQATLIGFDLMGVEGLIAALAVTATAIAVLSVYVPRDDDRLARSIPPLALVLSILPVLLGLAGHVRATSDAAEALALRYDTTWVFVAAMLLVAAANRVSAYIYRQRSPSLAAVYLCFTGGALVVAAAAGLRQFGLTAVYSQVVWLMWIPIGYMVAARLWRGQSPERPLAWVAQVTAAVLIGHVMLAAAYQLASSRESVAHGELALILAEATVFYALAALLRKQAVNSYLAIAAGCGTVWQTMLYLQWSHDLFTLIFALFGLALLAASRSFATEVEQIYNIKGKERSIERGMGVWVAHVGNAVLSIAILIAFMRGLTRLVAAGLDGRQLLTMEWASLVVVTIAAAIAMAVSKSPSWRRLYTVGTIAMAALGLLMLNVAVDISGWRKLEAFLVVVGLILLGVGYVGRFRDEQSGAAQDSVSLSLWMGSLLTAFPLALAVFYHWGSAGTFALVDELTLLTITIVLLTTGLVWQLKAPTLLFGATLVVYLAALVVSVLYQPQVAIGIYLAAGGAALFGLGLLLAVYRDRLATLPDQIANREGLFRIIGWR